MEQVIKLTDLSIKTLIEKLEDIQKEIIEIRNKNRKLGKTGINDWDKEEESLIKEIQEEIINTEIIINQTEIQKGIIWKKRNITEQ